MVLWLEQARAVLLPPLKVALGLVPWVARGFPGCWEVTLPPPFLIPAVGKGFFWTIRGKVVVWSPMTGVHLALL